MAEPITAQIRIGSAFSFLVFLAALLPRLLYLALARPPFAGDYWDLATSLLRSGTFGFGGYQTTRFNPLYPFFLAAVRSVASDSMLAAQIMQTMVAALGAVCLCHLAASLSGSRRTALVAALLYAGYPLLVRHAPDASDAALSATLLLAFAAVFVRAERPGGFAAAGLILGLAVLTRSMMLPLVPMAAGLLVWRRSIVAAAVLSVTCLGLLAPWAARNYGLNGWPMPTRSGLNLFISNNEYSPTLIPRFGPDILVPYANAVIGPPPDGVSVPVRERMMDIAWTEATLDAVRRQPGAILWLKARNLWYFISPRLVPRHRPAPGMDIQLAEDGTWSVSGSPARRRVNQLLYSLSYGPILALALLGVYWRRRHLGDDALLWCVLGTFAAVHAVYFPTTRYRVPVEFVPLFYAAVAIEAGAGRWLARLRPV